MNKLFDKYFCQFSHCNYTFQVKAILNDLSILLNFDALKLQAIFFQHNKTTLYKLHITKS